MLFHDSSFIIFLVWVVLIYYSFCNPLWQNTVILFSSILFILNSGFSNLLVVSGVIFFTASYFYFTNKYGRSTKLTIVSIVLLTLNLLIFKYSGFLSEAVGIGRYDLKPTNWIIPLGISFYTFQIIGAIIDFHAKRLSISPNRISLFTVFFPQIISGPIVKYRLLGTEFLTAHKFRSTNIHKGLYLFTVGYMKKVLIADPIGSAIDPVWSSPQNYSSLTLFIASVCFYIQVFADFSGYTDMGRGAARMLGFRLPINFRAPFFAKSLSEFWLRWHISLTLWIRTYCFNSLAMLVIRNSPIQFQKYMLFTATVFIMVIIGLWHGANWNFVLFGLFHGLGIVVWDAVGKGKAPKKIFSILLCIFLTQLFVIFSLIFFRSENAEHAFTIIFKIVQFKNGINDDILYIGLTVSLLLTLGFQVIENCIKYRKISNILFFLRNTKIGLVVVVLFLFVSVALKGNIFSEEIEFFKYSFFDQENINFIYFEF